MKKNFLECSSLSSYKKSFDFSNLIWNEVDEWDYFEKITIGNQLVRSADSISANIAEGFGRYGKKDKIKFYRYSFSSVLEVKDWVEKAKIRNIISIEKYTNFLSFIEQLPIEINQLIKYTNQTLKF